MPANPDRTPWRLLAALLALAVAAWVGGFLWFLAIIPDQPTTSMEATDGIVVLTGGDLRLNEGVRLLTEGKARQLLISGVDERVDIEQVLTLADGAPPELACCITLGYQALTTAGNASETANWMARLNLKTLRLVTAAYHMPRSLLEFRHYLPNTAIIAHPVFPETGEAGTSASVLRAFTLRAKEFTKYLVAAVRHAVSPPPAPASGRSSP